MTEGRIFEILLQNNKNEDYKFDYPKLQEKAVNCVAKRFTDIIYDTLKQKSSASNIKRGNVLKFINNLCEVKECHLIEENYKCFLKVVKNSFKDIEDENVTKLCSDINSDLKQYMPNTFADEVVAFYKKKQARQKEKIRNLEFIKMMDQEGLNQKYDMQVRKNFSYYETNEDLIRELLKNISCHSLDNKTTFQQIESDEYRERQIQLAYALTNLNNEDTCIVERILQRISNYTILKEYEVNFIQYLWVSNGANVSSSELLAEKFPFILERIILKHATELLLLEDEIDVHQYFVNLGGNGKFSTIKKICQNNPAIYYSLKNLIHELYCYSYCNENILRLVGFII